MGSRADIAPHRNSLREPRVAQCFRASNLAQGSEPPEPTQGEEGSDVEAAFPNSPAFESIPTPSTMKVVRMALHAVDGPFVAARSGLPQARSRLASVPDRAPDFGAAYRAGGVK